MTGRPEVSPARPWMGSVLLLPGGVVMVQGPALSALCRAMRTALGSGRANGIAPADRHHPMVQLFVVLETARMDAAAAARGSAEVPQVDELPQSAPDLIDTKEAAQLLGCGVRNVRDLVARGVLVGGRTLGRRLLLDRLEVEGEAMRRARYRREEEERRVG